MPGANQIEVTGPTVLGVGAVLDGEYLKRSGTTVVGGTAEAAGAVATHEAAADPHTGYQKESEKDAASGYAGLNAQSRITKGAITTDDLIVNNNAKGLVLKDEQATAHYWRVTVNSATGLVLTDLGTSPP